MSFLKQGKWQWIKEKKKSRRGEITYAPTGVWVIGVEDLNKILVDTFSSEFSRDVIWDVAKARANLNGNQFRVRKAIPEHLAPVCRKTSGKWKPTRQEEKSLKRYMASFIEKRLEGFEKHFDDHIQTQDEEAKELESPTFEAFCKEHYLPHRDQERYPSMLERWVYPVIGHIKLSELMVSDMQNIIDRCRKGATMINGHTGKPEFAKQGEGATTKILSITTACINVAEDMDTMAVLDGKEPHLLQGRRPHNKRLLRNKPKTIKHSKPPPSSSDNVLLLRHTRTHHPGMHYLIAMSVWTGTRISETIALKWSDIRWMEKRVEVTKQWKKVGGVWGLHPTKTNTTGTRVILDIFLDDLKQWQKTAPRYDEVAKRCTVSSTGAYKLKGGGYGGIIPICTGEFIFCHPSGNPFPYAGLADRLNKILKTLGIKKPREAFHAYRRSYASELAAQFRQQGKDPFLVFKALGVWEDRESFDRYIYDVDRYDIEEVFEKAYKNMPYSKLSQLQVTPRDKREDILKTRNGNWYIRFSYTEDGKEEFIKKSTKLKATEDNKEAALEFGATLYKKVMGFDIQER
tara:strand:- start:1424 stop:3139 length:1716 start_codon:yes stop_codon:yes gene_type:complete